MLPYTILVDESTGIVLSVSQYPSSLVDVADCLEESLCVHSANYPNYWTRFFLAWARPDTYIAWRWDSGARTFVKTPPDMLTPSIRERSQNATEKRDAFVTMALVLSNVRMRFDTGIAHQDFVYTTKRAQAESFKQSGYDESRSIDYPYVIQYADYAKIPLSQAADDIIFKAKLNDEFLAQTEWLRLKYFNLVKKAETSEEIKKVLEGFWRHFSAAKRVSNI